MIHLNNFAVRICTHFRRKTPFFSSDYRDCLYADHSSKFILFTIKICTQFKNQSIKLIAIDVVEPGTSKLRKITKLSIFGRSHDFYYVMLL